MATKQKTTGTTIRRAEVAKAGKRKRFWTRPPARTHGVSFYDARSLRRQRLDGAFGAAPIHVWNHLIIGTNGREKLNKKQLSALAKRIREAQKAHLYEGDE
jgi:hypothetical protein